MASTSNSEIERSSEMKTDPNLDLLFSAEELPVAIDNLNKFVPYFIDDLCSDCSESLSNRINLLDLGAVGSAEKAESNEDEKMYKRFMNVKRKKDFVCMEKVDGEIVNILKGVELHTNVFDSKEQSNIVDLVHELEKIELEKKRSYLPPRNNGSGKGRVALQFGCCYDNQEEGKPGEILCNVSADRMPEPLLRMIGRLVSWHVLPASCVPDSCIVQIYHKGDLILPHKDNSDFERPFCTVSLLSECNIGFGSSIKTYNERGKFSGPIAITLPVGSVLVLQGNGADVAQHCVPSVAEERISITFRKMKLDKRPRDFVDEPLLKMLVPLPYESDDSQVLKIKVKIPFFAKLQPKEPLFTPTPRDRGQGRGGEQILTCTPRGRNGGRGQILTFTPRGRGRGRDQGREQDQGRGQDHRRGRGQK